MHPDPPHIRATQQPREADGLSSLITPVAPTATSECPLQPDEVNRLWQHGMHEERLFHDRLNYFSALQIGLLGVFAILYHKEPAPGVFVPLIVVALAFTLLWLVVQVRHRRYCVHVHVLVRRAVPEYGRTVASFAGPRRSDGLSIARPLAFAAPLLFAVIWVALLAWAIVRSRG